jgi:Protein of unknown function (DUF1501)
MFTLLGSGQQFCDGLTRRSFLKVGAFGAGLSFADLLRLRAATARKPAAKSAIMIFLNGGPPHIDMYDMKPDAPAEYRGPWKPIQTNVPGVQISELFPLQARMWDKLAVIRSVTCSPQTDHTDAEVMTGYPLGNGGSTQGREVRPSAGSVISRVRSADGNGVPQFVSLRSKELYPWTVGLKPHYLGQAHQPFTPDGPGTGDLRLANDVSMVRLEDRKALLARFDTLRRDIDRSGAMEGLDAFTTRAFDVIASGAVYNALDLSREDPKTRARYKGVEQCLIARRLVEAGVGCVTLTLGLYSWDMHGGISSLRTMLPNVDRGVSNLIQDFEDRGMARDVVTVMWGEFGRTPKINERGGRDHWLPVMSALLAGGGLRMGQAIGSTTPRAEFARDLPYRVPQVLSTIYQALGIDAAQSFPDYDGRPKCILDDREPVAELT